METTSLLLARGADVGARAEPSGRRTPLHCAAGRCHVEVCAAMVAAGADPAALDATGATPFDDAVRSGRANDALRAVLGLMVVS